MDEYYQILGLSPDASRMQVKKAYRRLALQFHPDVNEEQDAKEKFQQIHQAYEVLTGNSVLNIPFTRYASPKYAYRSNEQQKQAAKERARQRAQMQYEEFCRNNAIFQHSWYYRPVQLLVFLIFLAGWAFGIFLIFSPLLVCAYLYVKGGFWWQGCLCLPLILAGLLVIFQVIRLRKEASLYFKTPDSMAGAG